MNKLLQAMQTSDTRTLNGMLTNSSSLNSCVNFFFTVGAMRKADESRIVAEFSQAFNEDALTAMKLLFWARDIRGGAGERRLGRLIFKYLATNHEEILIKNLHLIPVYGRWDDLLDIIECTSGTVQTAALDVIKKGLLVDKDSLCAKWMPRPNKNGVFLANVIRKHLGLSPKSYRKLLAEMSYVVETPMCAKDYSGINYSHVPSLAMTRYTKAFNRNDAQRFMEYKAAIVKGEAKINAGAVYPHDVIRTFRRDSKIANAQWSALPNWMEGSTEKILPMCDVSGSMSGLPMDVSIALGIYISERNVGQFKDHFLTFASEPCLQKLSGTLSDRIRQVKGPVGYDTNLEAAFRTVLNSAVRGKVPASEMPTMILILSDMEFNNSEIGGTSVGAFEMAKKLYEQAGYKLPKIVFWNLDAKTDNYPVRFHETGTALVSGFSPSILTALLSGKDFTPKGIMMSKISESRYDAITI